jgi:hypothetical protein
MVAVSHYYFMPSERLKIIRTFLLNQAVLNVGGFIQYPETGFNVK